MHLYKYKSIKDLNSREINITSLPENKKRDEHGTSFQSPPKFTELMLKYLSCLVSVENNIKLLFKKFKKKLAVTPGALICIPE